MTRRIPAVCVVLALLWAVPATAHAQSLDIGVLTSEITSYPVRCMAAMVEGRCQQGRGLRLNPTTFSVNGDQQEIEANGKFSQAVQGGLHLREKLRRLTAPHITGVL